MHRKTLTLLVLVLFALAGGSWFDGHGTAQARPMPLSQCVDGGVFTAQPTINAASNQVGTVGTGYAGAVSNEGACSVTYTVTWYRAFQANSVTGTTVQTNTITCPSACTTAQKTFTRTAIAADVGWYIRLKVKAATGLNQANAYSNAWGPITTVVNPPPPPPPAPPPPPPPTNYITYGVYIDGVFRLNFEVKTPSRMGAQGAEPQIKPAPNNVCEGFDASFFNSNFTANPGQPLGFMDLGSFSAAGYPNVGASAAGPPPYQSLRMSSAGGGTCNPGIYNIAFWQDTVPLSASTTLELDGAWNVPANGIMLHSWWVLGNKFCATYPNDFCDWIEVGMFEGGVNNCGLTWLNNPTFYIETLRNRSSSSFTGGGCDTPVGAEVAHWHDGPRTQEFRVYNTTTYGSQHTLEFRYVSSR